MVVGQRFLDGALLCLLLIACLPYSVSGTEFVDVFASNAGIVSAGGRHLQQISEPCPHQFGLDNFTILLDACPYPNATFGPDQEATYPKKQCCAALATMWCPYINLINNPNYLCVSEYFSDVSLIGNYTTQPQQFFDVICTDPNSPQGIPCPNGTIGSTALTAPAPSHSSPIVGYGVPFLLMIFVFELVVLAF